MPREDGIPALAFRTTAKTTATPRSPPAGRWVVEDLGLPFDILRLDQQRLDNYYLLDREGQPRYGTILWIANPDAARNRLHKSWVLGISG